RRFVDSGDSSAESAVGKVLGVLRPMWELASGSVPRLVDGNVDKAKEILQTAAWSQTAYYRDKDVRAMCMEPTPFSDAQSSGRQPLPPGDRRRGGEDAGRRQSRARRGAGRSGIAAGARRVLGAEGAGRRGRALHRRERRAEPVRLARDADDAVCRNGAAERSDV